MDLIEDFGASKLYIMLSDPVNCLVEEGVSNSGSGEQGRSH